MNKHINENILDWLKSAVAWGRKQIIFIDENSAIASDGSRAHAINADDLPENIHGIPMLSLFDNQDLKCSFVINPMFLYEALQIFTQNNSSVKIELIGNDEEETKRIIISNDENYTAIIMCIKDKSEDND